MLTLEMKLFSVVLFYVVFHYSSNLLQFIRTLVSTIRSTHKQCSEHVIYLCVCMFSLKG